MVTVLIVDEGITEAKNTRLNANYSPNVSYSRNSRLNSNHAIIHFYYFHLLGPSVFKIA